MKTITKEKVEEAGFFATESDKDTFANPDIKKNNNIHITYHKDKDIWWIYPDFSGCSGSEVINISDITKRVAQYSLEKGKIIRASEIRELLNI